MTESELKYFRECLFLEKFCESNGLNFKTFKKEAPPKPDFSGKDSKGRGIFIELTQVLEGDWKLVGRNHEKKIFCSDATKFLNSNLENINHSIEEIYLTFKFLPKRKDYEVAFKNILGFIKDNISSNKKPTFINSFEENLNFIAWLLISYDSYSNKGLKLSHNRRQISLDDFPNLLKETINKKIQKRYPTDKTPLWLLVTLDNYIGSSDLENLSIEIKNNSFDQIYIQLVDRLNNYPLFALQNNSFKPINQPIC